MHCSTAQVNHNRTCSLVIRVRRPARFDAMCWRWLLPFLSAAVGAVSKTAKACLPASDDATAQSAFNEIYENKMTCSQRENP